MKKSKRSKNNVDPSRFQTRTGALAVPERSVKKLSQVDVFFSELEQWGRILRNLS
jgi:hypothetical protein